MSVIEKIITDNLDIWSSAIKAKSAAGRGTSKKLELYGIKKLRELILELAVRGLLVPQVANDEHASVLLDKIFTEKDRLIKEKEIKKPTALSVITNEEELFKIPASWVWTRLGNVVDIVRGITFPGSEKTNVPETGRLACLRTTNVQDIIEWDDLLYIREQFIKRKEQIIQVKDVVMSMANSRELVGKVAIIETEPEYKTTFGGFLGVLRPRMIDPFYLMVLLRTPLNRNLLINSSSQTTNIANISLAKLNPLVLAIPPLAEQHRIAAKVDELMALCDQLEQQTETSNSAHQALVETLLDALTNSSERDGFNQAWARIAEHFDTLFTTEWSIDQLKQTILQLAVMGKLVPQNPEDEPSCKLFEKLGSERDKWIKENINSNPECKTMARKLEKLTEPSLPFPLPESWCCVHLIQLSQQLVDCHNKTAPYVDSGIPIIRTTNIRDREFRLEGMKYVTEETYEYWSRRCPPKSGDIMFTREAPMGEAAVIPEGVKWCLGQRTMLIRPMHGYVSEKYLLLALTEPHLLERASEHAIGSTVKHLRVGDVENLNIPLPPFEEQQRIAAKVDELMIICDTLKSHINSAQTTQLHLADAIAEQAVA